MLPDVTTPRPEGPRMLELLTYDDIERLVKGRIKARSLARYQAVAAARREAGTALRTDMPAPVASKPNPASANLPDQPLFDGTQIRTWLADTDRLVETT